MTDAKPHPGAISVDFNSSLCIHARSCVTQAPKVFHPDTAGAWITEDELAPELVAAVIRNCPSGALTYETSREDLAERPPSINSVRLRENGPYAFYADLRLEGEDGACIRRTLCRCGASRRKPYCDGSHAAIGFVATGEPQADALAALPERGGPLQITPLPNGPLRLRGPLEVLSGCGRAIARVQSCDLCRCGASKTKPFCDGSHARIGFSDAEGEARSEALVRGYSAKQDVPTLTTWLGGRQRLGELTTAFYARVLEDPQLSPVFAHMQPDHAERVADFIAEVFGGAPLYSDGGGSHAGMIAKHLGRHLSEAQRARWVALMLETVDQIGLPSDAEFRAALVGYFEWGTRLALANSQAGVEPPTGEMPMPRWGWGPPGGPWTG